MSDIIRDPENWVWGVRGGNPEVAKKDMEDLLCGAPLHAVAHLKRGPFLRQGVFVMNTPGRGDISWRRWRLFLDYGKPISFSPPIEVLEVRNASSFWELQVRGVKIVKFNSGGNVWDMAIMNIDVAVVVAALGGSGPQISSY